MWFRLKLVGILLVIIIFSCCALVIGPYYPTRTAWPGQIFFDHRYQLSSGGSIDLMIGDFEAEIEITGQEEEEVHIVASQDLPFYQRGIMIGGAGRFFPRIRVESQESSLKIRLEGRRKTILPVKISLKVPRQVNFNEISLKEGNVSIKNLTGSVKAGLERGNLKVTDFSGSIEASVIKGNIEAEILNIRESDKIELLTEEGDITLFLEPEVKSTIEAQAFDGHLAFEFPHEEIKNNYLVTTLNEGKAKIILKTMKGDIKIKKLNRGLNGGDKESQALRSNYFALSSDCNRGGLFFLRS